MQSQNISNGNVKKNKWLQHKCQVNGDAKMLGPFHTELLAIELVLVMHH